MIKDLTIDSCNANIKKKNNFVHVFLKPGGLGLEAFS